MALWRIWKWRGKGLEFTEFRYIQPEMEGFLRRTDFDIVEVQPDDFFPPWEKGLFCDVCDVGCFFGYAHQPPFEFGSGRPRPRPRPAQLQPVVRGRAASSSSPAPASC